ncbi:microfibril-associated glycoprotein 4-like [Styela clava]
MLLRFAAILWGIFAVVNGNICRTAGEFCSQVNQFCFQQSTDQIEPSFQLPRVGKAGPQGIKGDRGHPAVVNYTAIEEKIEKKYREIEDRIDAKLSKYDAMLNEKVAKEEFKYELDKHLHHDCSEVSNEEAKTWNNNGGVVDIFPNINKYEVYCDISTDGNKWTVIQRRQDGSVDFNRNWADYVAGFGNRSGEFWLGLEAIRKLTQTANYVLKIELTDWAGQTRYAEYGSFALGSAETKYRLSVGGFSGTAGDSLSYHNKNKFSTADQDNDQHSSNCASVHGGGWWFNACDHSNLNGQYHVGGAYSGSENGVEWEKWPHNGQYSMKKTVMKLRPKI